MAGDRMADVDTTFRAGVFCEYLVGVVLTPPPHCPMRSTRRTAPQDPIARISHRQLLRDVRPRSSITPARDRAATTRITSTALTTVLDARTVRDPGPELVSRLARSVVTGEPVAITPDARVPRRLMSADRPHQRDDIQRAGYVAGALARYDIPDNKSVCFER